MSRKMKLLLIGGIGLTAGTALAIAFEDAGELAGTAIMLILCMSAALCGAAVPGVIQLDSKPIRATGAAVFFVLPWVLLPAPVAGASGDDPGAGSEQPGGVGDPPKPGAERPPAPAQPNPPSAGTRPPIRIPPPGAAKPPEKPKIARPRTVFDGLFSRK